MKVLLIQPPIQDFYQTSIRTQPIGLAYLAASLKSHGYEVEILDCQIGNKKPIPIPSELSYLRGFYPFDDRSPFKLYTGYYHFGMGWREVEEKIKNSKADVFGISSSFTPYHGEALEMARIIKEWDPKKIVVMGGAHVSCDPVSALQSPVQQNPHVDYVVMGEGEIRFPSLLERIERKGKGSIKDIDGIGYRENGEIKINPLQTYIRNLDSLPFPARELLDLERYRIKKKRSTMIITSRGCPHRCAYCSAHLVMGSSFRTRSPDAIIKEMAECRRRYGIEDFDIEDDNFTFDRERAKKLMSHVIENFGEEKLNLSAMNGVSFASLDEELLKLMKRSGFKTINLSLVSINPFTKEKMGRPEGMTGFDKILKWAERVGLHVIAYAILGMPGQTVGEMVNTLIYLMGKRVLIGPSVYYPTPGTLLFERCKKEGILPSLFSQWRSSAFPVETKEFNRLDLLTLFRLARLINFIKGKMDRNELEEGLSWRELCSPCTMRSAAFNKVEEGAMTWIDLILLLVEERSFFSLKKDSHGKTSFSKIEGSKKVMDYFFEKARNKPILKAVP